jgi:uncharacterized protein YdaU (DUF1376 family)
MSSKLVTWMPLYIGDYLRDTMHLTTTQHGAYLLLLFACWTNGPLLDDDKHLGAITKLSPADWLEMRPTMENFFSVENGFWIHKRVEEEINNAKSMAAKRSTAGKAGMTSRWHNKTDNKQITKAITKPITNDNPSPSPSHRERERDSLSGGNSVELPSWYPQTETEAVAACMSSGVEEAFIRQVWNKGAGRGGLDSKSVPIRRFPNHVKTEWSYELERRSRQPKKIEYPETPYYPGCDPALNGSRPTPTA